MLQRLGIKQERKAKALGTMHAKQNAKSKIERKRPCGYLDGTVVTRLAQPRWTTVLLVSKSALLHGCQNGEGRLTRGIH